MDAHTHSFAKQRGESHQLPTRQAHLPRSAQQPLPRTFEKARHSLLARQAWRVEHANQGSMRARAQVPVKEKHGGKLAQSTPRGQLPSSDAWEVRAFVDENNRKVWSRELDPDASILKLPPNQELTPDQVACVFGYRRHLTEFFYIGKSLGAGSFGTVSLATDRLTNQIFAVKSIAKKPRNGKPCTPKFLVGIQTEVESMMQQGASLNAVYLKDVFEDRQYVHLVMELCTGGPMIARVGDSAVSEQEAARHTRSILRFLAQCHAKGIIYRDVKPDNFLFLTDDPDSPLKATDFGLAIRHWPQEGKLHSRTGTPAYMAPEVIQGEYDDKCDMWSTGVLMYQLLTGKFPFWDRNLYQMTPKEVFDAILNEPLDFDMDEELRKRVSPEARDLLSRLLVRDPEQRLSASEALEHPWIKEIDENSDKMHLSGTVLQRLQRFATYGRLKQLVLLSVAEEMVSSTGSFGGCLDDESPSFDAVDRTESFEGVQAMFKSMDTSSSGELMYNDMSMELREQGYKLTDDEVIQLLQRIDLRDDSRIDFCELASALLDWDELRKLSCFDMCVDAAFRKLDEDGKGYLDSQDMMNLLPAALDHASLPVKQREASRMIREIDTLHSGRLTKEEFVALLHEAYTGDELSQYDDRLLHPENNTRKWRQESNESWMSYDDPSCM